MAGNSFGQAFRITTAGESHGPANVVIIDGVPPGIPLSVDDLLIDLNRRRPGQSAIVTQRQESDEPEILSGVFEGRTTGTSLAILIRNRDQRSRDYSDIKDLYRPGHADYTFDAKYGFRDYRGGGRSSARETNVRVAAGVVAKKLLAEAFGGRVVGYVVQVGDVRADVADPAAVTLEQVETLPTGEPNVVRCPDYAAAGRMVQLIEDVRKEGDSIGGAAEIVASGIPPGLGEPVFDKIKADLAKALFSLPAVLGVEYGIGFGCVTMRGSQNNDVFVPAAAETALDPPPGGLVQERPGIVTASNRHGGMLGGITSGMPIVLRAAVKPTSSLPIEQPTVTNRGEPATIRTRGRHDPCLLPRFIPMAEAMVAIVLADHWLRWQAQRCSYPEGVSDQSPGSRA
ncbi:MAG TPA: chorismate synthase [Planctomycetaceae bacterium]|nr:chorismate synthase [Planctomycetaceae bacterium]